MIIPKHDELDVIFFRAYIDKREWGDGPWQHEPDHVELRYCGTPKFPCLISRSPTTGALCGYVGVPEGHPFFGVDPCLALDVHGGITYVGKCQGKICHVPRTGEPHVIWWLGFDCAHLDDFCPIFTSLDFWPGKLETYKGIHFVCREIASLAKQCADLWVESGLPSGGS